MLSVFQTGRGLPFKTTGKPAWWAVYWMGRATSAPNIAMGKAWGGCARTCKYHTHTTCTHSSNDTLERVDVLPGRMPLPQRSMQHTTSALGGEQVFESEWVGWGCRTPLPPWGWSVPYASQEFQGFFTNFGWALGRGGCARVDFRKVCGLVQVWARENVPRRGSLSYSRATPAEGAPQATRRGTRWRTSSARRSSRRRRSGPPPPSCPAS